MWFANVSVINEAIRYREYRSSVMEISVLDGYVVEDVLEYPHDCVKENHLISYHVLN